jgi:hypothetical protein
MSGERPDEAKEDEVDEGSQRARMLPISVNQTAESSFGAPHLSSHAAARLENPGSGFAFASKECLHRRPQAVSTVALLPAFVPHSSRERPGEVKKRRALPSTRMSRSASIFAHHRW